MTSCYSSSPATTMNNHNGSLLRRRSPSATLTRATTCLLLLSASVTTVQAFVGPPTLSQPTSVSSTTTTRSTPIHPSSSSLSRLQMSSVLTELATNYNHLLETAPLPTQAVTASLLAGVGDAIAQLQSQFSGDNKNDYQRLRQLVQERPQHTLHFRLPMPMTGRRRQLLSIDLDRSRKFLLKGLGGGLIWSVWFGLADEWTYSILHQEWGDSHTTLLSMLMMGDTAPLTATGTSLDVMNTMSADSIQTAADTVTATMDANAAIDSLPLSLLDDTTSATTVLDTSVVDEDLDFATPASLAVAKTVIPILLEQFIAVPLIYTFWDIPVPTLLGDEDNASIPNQVREKLPSLLLENAKVWTFANIVIYNLPAQYRVLATSVADLVWQSILSQQIMGTTTTTPTTSSSAAADVADLKQVQKLKPLPKPQPQQPKVGEVVV